MQRDKPDNEKYSVTALLGDPSFVRWALQQDPTVTARWESWTAANPENAATATTAKQLLLQIRFVEHVPTEEMVTQSYQRFTGNIAQLRQSPVQRRRLYAVFTWRRAAIWTGLLAVAGTTAFYIWRQQTTLKVSTAFGEIRQVVLPDSSLVTLRANSTLQYRRSLNGQLRELWLHGEAWFRVNPDKKAAGFVVHTADADVTVLGTTFDLKQRKHHTAIFLQSGKVRVDFHDPQRTSRVLSPGDLVEYDAQARQVAASKADSSYTSWTQGKLTLTDAPLSDIIDILENNYGEKIVVNDEKIKERKIEGIIYLENKADILFIISNVLDIQISRKNDTMYFSNRK
ncbi:ferric-dicitrate binding protein FerR, regulates iron transport through sigma-19 [Chitinophaga eiseniae]|uniref:Ferric-dicitrate binding protein FerR, regulates iron transport through sigma-19 n=1 Tax=Chitinophaga eiseniae TaxID=634771 RepID=A0A1T4TUS5_9BACT|nr:FecR domain-containing protein [Chitinophaga eiseniae]SKA43959.1 ferric-dicitrate binding protein FerR, regulates iron transport through sigma-19 [Chitinophaga eiseniae]